MHTQENKVYAPNGDHRIVELVKSHFPESQRIIDVGCGSGGNALLLKAAGFTVCGLTISEQEARAAAAICPVIICDLAAGLPDSIKQDTYDVALAAHVLEHIFYPDRLLVDIYNTCKHGIIVVIPNLLFWRNRIKMLFGLFKYAHLGIMDYTHSRWYTFRTIQDLLIKHGFVITSAMAQGGVFNNKSFWARKTNEYLLRVFPGLFGFQFYITARKSRNH